MGAAPTLHSAAGIFGDRHSGRGAPRPPPPWARPPPVAVRPVEACCACGAADAAMHMRVSADTPAANGFTRWEIDRFMRGAGYQTPNSRSPTAKSEQNIASWEPEVGRSYRGCAVRPPPSPPLDPPPDPPLEPPLVNPWLVTLDPELLLDDDDSTLDGDPPLSLDAVVGCGSRGWTRVYPSPSSTRPFPLGRLGLDPPPPSSITTYPPPPK